MHGHSDQAKRTTEGFDHVARPRRNEVTIVFVTPSIALVKLTIAVAVRAIAGRSGAVIIFAAAQALAVIVVPATPPYYMEECHADR